MAHAVRVYLDNLVEGRAFVKLDFSNAFNSVRRDCLLEAVALSLPDRLPFVQMAHGSPSHFWLGDEIPSSEEEVQQGDPLGSLLFSLTVQHLLVNSQCELTTGYLDDFGLGDQLPHLGRRIQVLESEALKLGLAVNHTKCEIFGLVPKDVSI